MWDVVGFGCGKGTAVSSSSFATEANPFTRIKPVECRQSNKNNFYLSFVPHIIYAVANAAVPLNRVRNV